MKNVIFNIKDSIGREVSISNKKYLFCSGTSYLGIWSNKSFHEKITEGISKFGSNFPMSRISNLRLSIFDEFEKHLSSIYEGYEAITFSSGYLTGQALINVFASKGEYIHNQNLHPALTNDFLNCSLTTKNQNDILKKINKSEGKTYIIFTNSVNSLYGEILDFNWLLKLREKNKILLVLDDSHGFGIIGEKNRGIVDYLPKVSNVEYVIMSSLGKAYGIPGGVVLCSQELKELLKESPFYTASSPVIPAYLYAYLNSLKIREEILNKLQGNIMQFKNAISNFNMFKYSSTFPVFYTTQNKLFEHCLKSNIFISSFPYPKEDDDNITRVVLNALHTNIDIKHIANSCKSFIKSTKSEHDYQLY